MHPGRQMIERGASRARGAWAASEGRAVIGIMFSVRPGSVWGRCRARARSGRVPVVACLIAVKPTGSPPVGGDPDRGHDSLSQGRIQPSGAAVGTPNHRRPRTPRARGPRGALRAATKSQDERTPVAGGDGVGVLASNRDRRAARKLQTRTLFRGAAAYAEWTRSVEIGDCPVSPPREQPLRIKRAPLDISEQGRWTTGIEGDFVLFPWSGVRSSRDPIGCRSLRGLGGLHDMGTSHMPQAPI